MAIRKAGTLMKDQYVCDIGDYGKYSLLRHFIESGVKVGVNWYLTDNDGTNDGKFKKYLENDDMKEYDPVIFGALKKIFRKEGNCVKEIEENVLPDALFYSACLSKSSSKNERKSWFEESISELSDVELIFMDPDNGLLVNSRTPSRKREKYILPCEVEQYFTSGHNVVYYCHKGRRTEDQWKAYKSFMSERLPDAKTIVLTYHKGTQRSYIFLVHDKYYPKYMETAEALRKQWHGAFTAE